MKFPEKGFYYHYKHNPEGEVGNYAYEVVGVGHHTEAAHIEGEPLSEGNLLVVYRPLYDAFVYRKGKLFDIRPLPMFLEKVVKDGKEMERFSKITDEKIIEELQKIKKEMYLE